MTSGLRPNLRYQPLPSAAGPCGDSDLPARRPTALRVLLLAAVLALPHAALAQSSADVKFPAGDYGTSVSGRITGQAYFDYRLDARGGQKISADLSVTESDGNGTVYFNILPPGSTGVAIYNGSMDGNSANVALPETGTYTIRVYQMGNDADAGRTSAFTLDLSVR